LIFEKLRYLIDRIMRITRKQILGILVGLLLSVWLFGSLGLYLFIKYPKGFDQIEFTDVAFPWNWDNVRPKWGNHFIETGLEHQQAGEWDKAFYFVRVGVAKAPANVEGRLALADMLFQANDIPYAVRVLEGGLDYASQDEEFWSKMISFLQYYQADQEIIRILQRGLDKSLIPESQTEIAKIALAKALYHQARYEDALEFVTANSNIPNQILRSQIHWEQGLESLAIQLMENLNRMFPNQREVIPQLTRFYDESGEKEKAYQLARNTYLSNPYSVGASVNYFRLRKEDALQEVERFLERVPEILENQDALFTLANYLAEAGHHQKLSELVEEGPDTFREAPMVWFLQVESLVNAGEYQKAIDRLNSPPETVNQLIPLHRILFHSLAMTSYFALGAADEGKGSMQQLFTSGHIRPATLLRLSRKLMEIGSEAEAEVVLKYLLKQNPGNHAALVEIIRIELMTGNTQQAIVKSIPMVENKSMPFQLKKELMTYLASDRQLYYRQGGKIVNQILETMTPSKKQQLLEIL
jgi:tetratricopeptide (TPR) repeat protein